MAPSACHSGSGVKQVGRKDLLRCFPDCLVVKSLSSEFNPRHVAVHHLEHSGSSTRNLSFLELARQRLSGPRIVDGPLPASATSLFLRGVTSSPCAAAESRSPSAVAGCFGQTPASYVISFQILRSLSESDCRVLLQIVDADRVQWFESCASSPW